MPKRIAKRGDLIIGLCHHQCLTGAPTPTPMDLPFRAPIRSMTSSSVFANGKLVAVRESEGLNELRHLPRPVGGMAEFASILASRSVFAGTKPVAAHGDPAKTCDEAGQMAHLVVADGTVLVGE